MKIDLLTFHFVSNDGGVLQCYALQRFLEKEGHQVQVIDYRPSYHTIRYDAVKNPFIYTRWYWRMFRNLSLLPRTIRAARSFVRCLYLNARREERTTAKIFDGFVRKNLHLTERYLTLKQLQNNPPQADAYVVGSDQLWNPDLLDFEFDPAYFLDFGDKAIPHVSYAISAGKQLNETELAQMSKLCGRLSAVSIRECGPSEFLTLIKNARYVVTNSFYGTAFSIVYKKEFVTIAHSTRGSRMTELLNKLGLLTRLWGHEDFSMDNLIKWESVQEKLGILRAHSMEYLLAAITGKKGEEIPHADEECQQINAGENRKVFAGFLMDREELRSSASGGAGTALAKTVIDNGGVVVGAAYADDFKAAEYVVAEKTEDLQRLKGSKYIPARKNSGGIIIFEKVQNLLTEGRQVLFIGLPCDVGALLSWLEKRGIATENLITVDLICHGCTAEKVQQLFIDSLEKKYASAMEWFTTRYVHKNWSLPYVYARFKNGKVFKKPLYETDLGFALKYYVRPSCFNCQFKGEDHRADITIGDYWGLRPKNPLYNKDGVSIFIVRSPKGLALLDKIDRSSFDFKEVSHDALTGHNPMYAQSTKKPVFYEEFEKDLTANGLREAVVHSPGYGIYKKAALKNRLLLMLGKK